VLADYEPLSLDFYARPSIAVARELIGHLLLRRIGEEWVSGWIVETEAYDGASDPASHAYRGESDRNRVMFGPAGHLYVYRSYGVHFCANVVTGPRGRASAVLLRALQPEHGLDAMRRLRGLEREQLLCSGPGRLCQALNISRDDNGKTLLAGHTLIAVRRRQFPVAATPRIGISVAKDRPWRFVVPGSAYLSRPYRVKT
jgi:DNA-3-methyladenine glycosylase